MLIGSSHRYAKYLGCCSAYGVFLWRYLNVPENWSYVRSPWSIAIMVLTLLPETIYPIIYLSQRRHDNDKAKGG